MKKGLAIFMMVAIVLVFATFIPSVNAAPYDKYKLVDSWISGNYKTCLYMNVRKEQRTKSVSKGRSCPSVY